MNKLDILRWLYKETANNLKEPYWGLPKKIFEYRSCQKWAIEEVLKAIEASDLPPVMVVEEFANRMDEYSCRGSKSSWMFSVAYDTAEWIIDILLSIK